MYCIYNIDIWLYKNNIKPSFKNKHFTISNIYFENPPIHIRYYFPYTIEYKIFSLS